MTKQCFNKKVKTVEEICARAEAGRGKIYEMERAANIVTWLYTFNSTDREKILELADRVTNCYENAILE